MTNIEILEKIRENAQGTCKTIKQLVEQKFKEEPDFIQAVIDSLIQKGDDSHANPSQP